MDSSYESDSDQDSMDSVHLDSIITEAEARENYEKSGKLVTADDDQIRIEDYQHLMDSSVTSFIDKVVDELSLPYNLSDFQTLSLNILLQKKDLILLSPTGTGKGS